MTCEWAWSLPQFQPLWTLISRKTEAMVATGNVKMFVVNGELNAKQQHFGILQHSKIPGRNDKLFLRMGGAPSMAPSEVGHGTGC